MAGERIRIAATCIALCCLFVAGCSILPARDGVLADRIAARYAVARNSANLDLLDEIYYPDVRVYDSTQPDVIRGRDALKAFYADSHSGFPDLRIDFDAVHAIDDMIVFRWTLTGTHLGDLRGIAPTGSRVRLSGMTLSRVRDGRIDAEWVSFNMLALMTQLGFTVAPPAN